MKNNLKNQHTFFKTILKPLTKQKQEEVLSVILKHKDDEMDALIDNMSDTKHRLLLFVDKDVDCFLEQCRELNKTHKIRDLFDVEDIAIDEALDMYVDWLDERGYELLNWFEGHYTFAYLLCKKTDTKALIKVAKEAGEELLALLPSHMMPDWFDRVHLPLALEDFDFRQLLQEKLNVAKSMHRNLFLCCSMRECKPCNIIEHNINHPLMQEACKDTYLLKIDILRGSNKLRSVYLNITSAPTFIHITQDAMPSKHQLDGDAWGEVDSVENISKALTPFFQDTNHKTYQPSQEEIEECFSFLPITGEYKAMKEMIDEIDIKSWQGENRILHSIAMSYRYHDGYAPLVKSMIKTLLDKGEDINSYNKEGFTPLMQSIRYGNWQIALLLLEYGANPTKYNKSGHESPFALLLFMLFWHKEVDEVECTEKADALLKKLESADNTDDFIDALEYYSFDLKNLIKKLYDAYDKEK